MTSIMIVGLGRVGSRTLKYLRELIPKASFIVVDTDKNKLVEVSKYEGIEAYQYEPGILGKLGEKVDLAVTALPSSIAWRSILELTSRCVSVVDVSFVNEDPYILEKVIGECNSFLVVDAGFAPGYSNIVAGYAFYKLGLKYNIEIAVGGIPEYPVPPIGYVVTWSARDLLEEYTRPARIIEDGVVKSVDPLAFIKNIEIPGIGVLEAFLSDGLRTMLRNIKARNLREYTLRWPGHISAIRLLRDLGFLNSDEVEINGVTIKPIDFTATLFEKKLSLKINDIAVLQVSASGDTLQYRETALLKGSIEDPATPVFTALVHAYTVKLGVEKKIKPGVIAPENLYEYKEEYEKYLASKGVVINKESTIQQ